MATSHARTSERTTELDAVAAHAAVWDCIARGDDDGLRALCGPGFRFTLNEMHDLDTDGMIGIVHAWRGAFSNFGQNREITFSFMSADGTEAAVCQRTTSLNDGDFPMPDGSMLSATGRTAAAAAIDCLKLDHGHISRWTTVFPDGTFLSMLQGTFRQQ